MSGSNSPDLQEAREWACSLNPKTHHINGRRIEVEPEDLEALKKIEAEEDFKLMIESRAKDDKLVDSIERAELEVRRKAAQRGIQFQGRM